MAPRSEAFKRIRQRLRRSLRYGDARMDRLTIQLTELVVRYFDRNCSSSSNNFLDLDFAASVSYDSCLDPCTLVAAMIYIERLRSKNPSAYSKSNPNDLYLASLIVASKFLNDCGLDEFIWNDEYAEMAKMNLQKINQLELRLLDNLDWDIMISDEQFDNAIENLERGVALSSAHSTGFLSYTDINTLATEFHPYLENMKRFVVMMLTVASAYVVLCTLSCSLLLGVNKTMEAVQEDVTTDADSNARFVIIDMAANNATQDECYAEYEFGQANKSVKFNLLNKVLSGNGKLKHSEHEPKLLNVQESLLKSHNCHSITHKSNVFQAQKMPTIVV